MNNSEYDSPYTVGLRSHWSWVKIFSQPMSAINNIEQSHFSSLSVSILHKQCYDIAPKTIIDQPFVGIIHLISNYNTYTTMRLTIQNIFRYICTLHKITALSNKPILPLAAILVGIFTGRSQSYLIFHRLFSQPRSAIIWELILSMNYRLANWL